ncbi:MAG: DUF2090 domain-containing protein [Proteobacteria bacterium]|nr:DUF2090 domain-containing protein [Pseudomonadota bacterium]
MKTSPQHTFDIIALGQSFVDFYGEQQGTGLKDMLSFKKHVGGMSSFALAFARLGLKTAIITSVGQDELGQFIIESLQHEKVDISQIQQNSDLHTSLAFRAIQNRFSFPLQHYKKQCADILEEASDISSSFIAKANALFITSSNFDSKNASRIIKEAIACANEKQSKVILALDYIDDDNQSTLLKVLPYCSLVIGAEQDYKYLSGQTDVLGALTQIRALTNALLVMKNNHGCYVYTQIPTDLHAVPHHLGFVTDKQIPFASKAAFIAGFVNGWLNGFSQEKSCEFAMACHALTQSREESCDSFPSLEELTIYLSSQSQVVQTIRTPFFEHLHYASLRSTPQNELYTFSFGHQQQWLKLAENACVDEDAINTAKMLIATGVQQAAMKCPNVCTLADANPENEIIDSLPSPHMLMRTLDVPGAVPLQFQGEGDITHTLLHWPKHHSVKLTFIYHPDDRYALRQQQEATLSHLYLACRKTNHELVIELAPATNSLITASTYSHIMQRLYEIGIYPDWWQVMPPRDQRTFENIQRVIQENDKFCKGVLTLGQQATLEQLPVMFNNAAKHECCKGFVVDKSLFQAALTQWLGQMMTNQAFIDTVARSFEKAISIWELAKTNAHVKQTAAAV